ncbi:restriction endonuclease subunit S [Ligilactobacillus sp. Marseille-Q7487]|uniref:restriction endonuclease subunit S n=1 Tax=Ligilactobacillus sp. Marseille-Q7487 TaxID=3022128 RepID=UPI0024A8CE79|nr:restriction endonuclease subunit S [Ligilactobacillus sp. Marseille-Q7487]
MNKGKIPKRRFKEFQNADAWEQRKLSEISDVRDGTHDSPKYVEQGHPFITSKNISDGSINYDDVQYISNGDFEEINKRSKVDINDILMGMIGTIGNIALIRTEPNFTIKNVALIKDTKQVDYLYLYNYLQSMSVEHQLANCMDGGTQKFIALGKIRQLEIMIPSEQEQVGIGHYLDSLDNLITLHQRKLEKLKNLKLAYLSEMFPAEGERKPKRRFSGFTGDWEQRKLGEVVEITMGQSPSSKNYTENPNDHILVQGNADMKNGHVVPRVWTTQITKQAEKGDLILSVRAPVGDIGKTDYDVVLGRGVAAIKGNSFIFQLLTKMKINGYWARFSTGSTFESINSDNIKNAQISIPSLREQEKIGGLFNEFDSLIALHQRKLEKLQNLKKAYLNEMFV